MPPEYDAATLREYCGTVALAPTADVVAGSWGTWTFTFTVGTYGMDDRSNLRLVMRGVCDWGAPNFTDPTAPNYCKVFTEGNAKLRVHFDRENHVRPWRRTIHVHVHDGTLEAGEHIWFVLGDRSGGSPGSQAQTFVESTFEFKFFADNFGTLQFRELPDAPVVRVVAGPTAHLVAQAPSMIAVDEEFAVLVRADDAWGNTATGFNGEVGLYLPHQAEPLASHAFSEHDGGVYRFTGLKFEEPGIMRLEARSDNPAFSVSAIPSTCRKIRPTCASTGATCTPKPKRLSARAVRTSTSPTPATTRGWTSWASRATTFRLQPSFGTSFRRL